MVSVERNYGSEKHEEYLFRMASTGTQENGRENGRVTTEVGGDPGGDFFNFLFFMIVFNDHFFKEVTFLNCLFFLTWFKLRQVRVDAGGRGWTGLELDWTGLDWTVTATATEQQLDCHWFCFVLGIGSVFTASNLCLWFLMLVVSHFLHLFETFMLHLCAVVSIFDKKTWEVPTK